MNCTTCDAQLEPGALFCANCGARVTPPSSAAAPTIVLPGAGAPQSVPPPSYPAQTYGDQYGSTGAQLSMPQPAYTISSPPTSTAATVSLIFGILAWVVLPFIAAIVAVVAGHMARNEIRASGGQIGGSGLATAGLVLGYAQIVLSVLACVAIGLFLVIVPTTAR